MLPKIKDFVKKNISDILLILAVVLISAFSFSLGYIVAKMEEKEPLKFEIYENTSINRNNS